MQTSSRVGTAHSGVHGIDESAEAVGRALPDLIVPPDQIEEQRRFLKEAYERGQSTYELIRKAKNGSRLHVNATSKAFRDTDGLLFFLWTEKDITHLKVLRDSRLIEAKTPSR
jgi:protein-histidine pros-kinase